MRNNRGSGYLLQPPMVCDPVRISAYNTVEGADRGFNKDFV